MSSTSIGREAESFVAVELQKQNYELLDQNWRTRFCEIDLVMKKDGVIYFIEVKYRSSSIQGSGLDYITPKKLKQMSFAAEYWLSQQKGEYIATLMAVDVDQNQKFDLIEL